MTNQQGPKKRIRRPLNITVHDDVREALQTLAQLDRTSKGGIVTKLVLKEKNRRALK